MGSCASVRRNTEADMKLGLSFGSKTENLMIPPSPVKEKHHDDNFRIDDIKSQRSPTRSTTAFRDYGSKEETFFDSKPCLDSDCEDDFYSVNGDFTPSRGNTPVHPFGTSNVNKSPFENRTPGSTPGRPPSRKKKNLLELFRESIREDHYPDVNHLSNQNMGNEKQEAKLSINDTLSKSSGSTPYISGTNSVCASERTPNGDPVSTKENSVKSMQGCLPSLVSCRSFRERKRRMSPAVVANGKI
ncbi:uncharacterized protein At3g27210 [Neltuma alba]|uniref:uncharacterized protein At3g27210 n=1 Tax=Neltuma alba TaxID=207710 RepID=UPI0010A4DF4C|nr:uncharacterized protein At3g27210-like [Prosopis alba]